MASRDYQQRQAITLDEVNKTCKLKERHKPINANKTQKDVQ